MKAILFSLLVSITIGCGERTNDMLAECLTRVEDQADMLRGMADLQLTLRDKLNACEVTNPNYWDE